MRRFEASPRRATPKGQTFINCTAPPSPELTYTAQPPAFVAHTPHSFCCSTHSLSPPTTLSGSRSPYRHTPSHVPCSSRSPDSRHLHTGHRLAGKRISRQTYPEVIHTPRF